MKIFLAILNAFPAILQSVQTVEAAVPLPQSGQQKLNLILGAAATAWEIGQAERQFLSKSATLTAVQTIANLSVAGLNAAGVFKTAAPVSSN